MRPRLPGLIAGLTVGATVFAAAASLGGLTVANLGAGSAPVVPCDSTVTATYTLGTTNNVTTVTISGIAPACAGGDLHVTLANVSGAALAAGGATVTGASVSVAVTPTPFAGDVKQTHVVITGP